MDFPVSRIIRLLKQRLERKIYGSQPPFHSGRWLTSDEYMVLVNTLTECEVLVHSLEKFLEKDIDKDICN